MRVLVLMMQLLCGAGEVVHAAGVVPRVVPRVAAEVGREEAVEAEDVGGVAVVTPCSPKSKGSTRVGSKRLQQKPSR